MTVPDYQTMMLPVLQALGDRAEWPVQPLIERVADGFNLTIDDRKELLPSGRIPLYANRIHWALTYLVKAGLAKRPRRAVIQITDEGGRVLAAHPTRVDNKFLDRYPSFVEFRHRHDGESSAPASPTDNESIAETPQEALERAWGTLRQQVAADILDRLRECSPRRFEEIVVDLLVKMGYGGSYADAAASVVGQPGDEGIDGIIKEDRLGLDAVYVQAKRWNSGHSVQRQDVQAFVGSLEGKRARKGVMITTSTFSSGAKTYATAIEKKVILLDGQALAELMIEFGAGVSRIQSYDLDRVDEDYFGDELA